MGWFQKYIYGVDLEVEQGRNDEFNAQLADLNKQALQDGKWTQAQFDAAEKNRLGGNIPDIEKDVTSVVKDSIREQIDDFRENVGGVVGFSIEGIFRAVPWQVWIVGGVILFVYMGGLGLLKGMLKK